jgi:acetyl-CoA C-acetyltransferase
MAFIVAAARTAGGRRGGSLSGWHPADLGAQVLNSLVRNALGFMIHNIIIYAYF